LNPGKQAGMTEKITKSEAEWRAQLTPEQFHVTRKHGTERAGSHPHNQVGANDTFACVCCGAPLFSAADKFESGTGWPSFVRPIVPEAVEEHSDRSFFMKRTEIRCARCDAQLGHVFPDGPPPTGQRYCMNGVALDVKTGETA
jgi:peptide-methionine (R)-S-oxide reductase